MLTISLVNDSGWSTSIYAAHRSPAWLRGFAWVVAPASLLAATLMLHDHGRPLSSAALAGLIWLTLIVASWIQLPTRSRRRVAAFTGIGSLAVTAVVASAALNLRDAYDSTRIAEAEIRNGLLAAKDTNFDAVEESIERASFNLSNAADSFGSPFVSALAHTPVVGPNLQSVDEVLVSANKVINSGQSLAGETRQLDQLIGDNGIAVPKVNRLTEEADALLNRAQDLHGTLVKERNVWVLPALDTRLREVAERTAPLDELGELSFANAVQGLLGGQEERAYLVLLGNTAEARELGGFAGGMALLRVDDGDVTLERMDRPLTFNEFPTDPSVFTQVPPQRFLEHQPWLFAQNYTAMIDFSSLADSLADLYPNMRGEEIDGVAYIDPRALAAVLGLAGEVHLDQANMTVDSESISHLVNVGQYERFDERSDREEFLGELIATTFDEVLGAGAELKFENLPALVSAIRQDRLMFVPFDDEEFATMEAAGLVGALPESEGQDYLAVSHLNGGPNKLDAYLHRTVDYQAEVDPRTGEITATVTISLENRAPLGLSNYAAGNQHDYPVGTNRAFVVVHTPHDAVEWTGGDEPELTRSWAEFGLQRHEQVVIVPRGQSRTVTLQLRGSVNPGDYQIDIGHQPLVHNDALTVLVEPTTGRFGESAKRSGHELRAEFDLAQDTELSAVWTPVAIPSPARAVGGES